MDGLEFIHRMPIENLFVTLSQCKASEFRHVRYAHHDEKESPLSDQTKIKVITKMIHVPVAE